MNKGKEDNQEKEMFALAVGLMIGALSMMLTVRVFWSYSDQVMTIVYLEVFAYGAALFAMDYWEQLAQSEKVKMAFLGGGFIVLQSTIVHVLPLASGMIWMWSRTLGLIGLLLLAFLCARITATLPHRR